MTHEEHVSNATILVSLSMVATSDGGRRAPIVAGYRGQLWIGQTRADGGRVYWDVVIDPTGPNLDPGATGVARITLLALPAIVLSVGDRVEIYEGQRRVATGVVVPS